MKFCFLKKCQRGAIFTFTAVLIPLLMVFTGLAVDFGNMYAHHSRLQNAADSAALAGGYAYVNSNDTTSSHPNANAAANTYTKKNHPDADAVSYLYQARESEKKYTYFRITLKEKVPLYFLRFFPTLGNNMEISAIGCSRFRRGSSANSGGNSLFNNLFTMGGGFNSVNSIQNPDNYNIYQNRNNCSTYDGDIVFTNQNSYNNAKKNIYLKGEAFGKDGNSTITVNQAKSQGYLNEVKYDSSVDITKYYYETVQSMMTAATTYKITDQNQQNASSASLSALSDQGVNVIYYSIPNLNFNLSSAISGDTDNPLYIICNNINNFNTSANMTTGRPIVLIYLGQGTFWINCNGGTFTGNVYAPFGSVYVNDNRQMFYGSIVAGKDIGLQSQGYYVYKNYTGSSDEPGESEVILIDYNEISWD